jgi:hypothetical protein
MCPNRAKIKALSEESFFFRAFRWMNEKAIFPISGALLEQSAQFVNACEFMTNYANAHSNKIESTKASRAEAKKAK